MQVNGMEFNILDLEKIRKAKHIQRCRNRVLENDTFRLQEKRKKFFNWLNIQEPVAVCEQYALEDGEVISNKNQFVNDLPEFANTRMILSSESHCDIDVPDKKTGDFLIQEIILSLINFKIHFAVFKTSSQIGAHIIQYDFDDLIYLAQKKRKQTLIDFWKKIVPFGYFQYIDTKLFSTHKCPIEFACHYKYGEPFDLIYEHLPTKPIPKNLYYNGGKGIKF